MNTNATKSLKKWNEQWAQFIQSELNDNPNRLKLLMKFSDDGLKFIQDIKFIRTNWKPDNINDNSTGYIQCSFTSLGSEFSFEGDYDANFSLNSLEFVYFPSLAIEEKREVINIFKKFGINRMASDMESKKE